MGEKRLSDSVAEQILTMITMEKRFGPGDKLPNENELSKELEISRTTLREAVRALVANGILEIQRGRGTFVSQGIDADHLEFLTPLKDAGVNAGDLYEMRLIFEPEAAYYAAMRASDTELKQILAYGRRVEDKIQKNEDRTEVEQLFHRSIAKATHNEFMNQLMPVIYQGIGQGVTLSRQKEMAVKDTLNDHRLIMEFLEARNAEGARSAMRIHILHAMKELNI
ncbi:FadR/GntR family transcriptional regulator [Anaerostipes sp.]|uniref:FadR/GntR family transcriptional regulator n=1 Tax=Anaerostipes sp. TaxID=1872530 RepID=UPI0025C69C98|nr:FadR/GntR family transcriptional regulator [Anaerostipes sp.]MBS7006836.1 FadR family transcriptional regulator [Anaerostipes sp.]